MSIVFRKSGADRTTAVRADEMIDTAGVSTAIQAREYVSVLGHRRITWLGWVAIIVPFVRTAH